LNNALDIPSTQYGTPKATTKLTWIREIADLLDPSQNPGGFRLCQNAILERGAISPLLGLAQKAQSDAVVIKSLEVLARTAFSNPEAASIVATDEEFLLTLRVVLANREQPEKLVALQLAQAIAAASMEVKVQQTLPNLLAEVVPLLAEKSFAVLPQATLDVLVSISFGAPAAVMNYISWADVSNWVAHDMEAGRPSWLDQENLTVLACGLLASNILALSPQTCAGEDEVQARQKIQERLGGSNFLEFFVLAMDAAVTQREWPAYSGAFHSVSRLASVAFTLAGLGFRRQLVGAVAPLAKAVEINPDEHTTRLALLALRSLVRDLACLEVFLSLGEFRAETLEVLHKAGDEKEATDLHSCTTASENILAAVHMIHMQSRNQSAPSVRALAELFNEHSAMDGELTKKQLLKILPRVPIGPAKDVEASLSGDKTSKFGFLAFAQHIFGTPTLLGWWPSLMEDVSCLWNAPAFQQLQPPALSEVLLHYEMGASGLWKQQGSPGVSSEAILHEVLPAWRQPVEGEEVEELFAEIRGDTPLSFKEFGVWMCRYFQAVDKQRKEAGMS
jgi:hypothetical protein